MAKTQFFRIAVEGATATDGRTIKREWIEQSVAGFNTATYTPRINCEHIRGFSPEPPFNAYGSVVAVKAENYQLMLNGKPETRLALYGQFDANDQLITTNKAGQKIFTSCEFTENFAKTGKAGLVGVAITDNPASLGTEALAFSALKPMWDSRKADPANFFTSAEENDFQLEVPVPALDSETRSLFTQVLETIRGIAKPAVEPEKPKVPPANDNEARFTAIATGIEKLSGVVETSIGKIAGDVARLSGDLTTLKGDLESAEGGNRQPRKPATGGDASKFTATDC